MTVCQMMLFERVIGSRCCFRDAAEAVPQQIKLMVNAFAAMLSHPAGADLPLGNRLDDMLFQIVKFREDSGLREKFAVVIQELFNARQKREAYAHRSLIDHFTATVLPAKAHTFAKNIVGTDFLFNFNPSKFTDYTRSIQDLNKTHCTDRHREKKLVDNGFKAFSNAQNFTIFSS